MNDAGRDAMRDYAIASGMIQNPPEQHAAPAAPAQLYRPGVPFVPTDAVPLTDDEVRARGVGVTAGGDVVMFDKTLAGIAARG